MVPWASGCSSTASAGSSTPIQYLAAIGVEQTAEFRSSGVLYSRGRGREGVVVGPFGWMGCWVELVGVGWSWLELGVFPFFLGGGEKDGRSDMSPDTPMRRSELVPPSQTNPTQSVNLPIQPTPQKPSLNETSMPCNAHPSTSHPPIPNPPQAYNPSNSHIFTKTQPETPLPPTLLHSAPFRGGPASSLDRSSRRSWPPRRSPSRRRRRPAARPRRGSRWRWPGPASSAPGRAGRDTRGPRAWAE